MNRSNVPDVRPALLPVLFALVFMAFFWRVMISGHQFGYRDSAHFYYPLYQRVQQEWSKGHIPLWETEENSGMPLLGNPTAAVLYPGKLIFALAPDYAWGARLYVVAHVGLAAAGAFLLGRTLGLSRGGACLAALSYSFGMPVLFQYCNIIFLVGAGWLPIGLAGADRWLRRGERIGVAWLALSIAMAVLGGDPQAAYLTGVCSAAYAWCLERARRKSLEPLHGAPPDEGAWGKRVALLFVLGMLWIALTLGAELVFARTPEQVGKPPKPLAWAAWAGLGIRLLWVIAAVWLVRRWWKQPAPRVYPRMILGLFVAAILSGLLSAAQLLPAYEFTALSSRASAESSHDIYPFSLEPTRLIEFLCPLFYGSSFRGNSYWFGLVPPRHPAQIWVPSLYVGVLTVLLAGAAIFSKPREHAAAWKGWMLGILLVGLVASLGQFGSPLWLARNIPGAAQWLGPHDPIDEPPVRLDGHLRDGDGSLYWALACILPGFGGFRYPSKLLGPTTLALAMLAGLGLDMLIRRSEIRRVPRPWIALASVLLVSVLGVLIFRGQILQLFEGSILMDSWSIFGKFQPRAAWSAIAWSLLQPALIVLAAALLLLWFHQRPAILVLGILAIHALDITWANSGYVITVPQAILDQKPEILETIEKAEQENPTPGGRYRVHRMSFWQLAKWGETASSNIYQEYVEWERKTLMPKYAIPFGMEYTLTEGVSELYDYMFFFPPFEGVYTDNPMAKMMLGENSKEKLMAYPRRGFDMWNTRYFLLPYQLGNDPHRGIASFLVDATELVPEGRRDSEGKNQWNERLKEWGEEEDYRLLRNDKVYPRAWVVHDAKVLPPIQGMKRKDRESLMFEILYQNDPLWSVRSRPIYDPRRLAWLEVDSTVEVGPFLARTPAEPSEDPRITRYESDRVELEVDLKRPGIVILADVYYPGWKLTIDGKPAPILKTNRMMRGAGVQAGSHRLVYTYEPASVRWGLVGSGAGLIGWLAWLVFCRLQKQDPVLASRSEHSPEIF